MKSLRRLLVLATIGLVAALPVQAAQFTADQTTEIQSIVKSYLLQHPEVLRDAIVELDKREKQAEADAQKKALAQYAAPNSPLYDAPDAFAVGNPDGKITLVEFFDYNCGYCKRSIDDVQKLISTNPDLRVVLRDFPILSPSSIDAAIVADAAHRQFPGMKYWDYHRQLLATHGLVGKEQALGVAKAMGADMDKIAKDAKDPAIRSGLQQSDAVAKSLSLNGTPSFVVGDSVLIGAVGYDELNKAIGNVRRCGKAMCS